MTSQVQPRYEVRLSPPPASGYAIFDTRTGAFLSFVGPFKSAARALQSATYHNRAEANFKQARSNEKDHSCPVHHSFVLDPDGTRHCNFTSCTWTEGALQ